MASHIGKLPIAIPAGVDIKIDGNDIVVKGPKGEMSYVLPTGVTVKIEDNALFVGVMSADRAASAKHGLSRSLLASYIEGVSKGFEKKLEIVGTGYRVVAKGPALEFSLGYSHTITVEPPEGITFTVENATHLTVAGIDKQLVGEVAARIRKLRAPEPYKGKGIKYVGEYIRRKARKAGK